jgi:hypothetical protein
MGAPRKPKHQHQLEGTWNRAVANAPSGAMGTATGCPPMPADMTDPIARGCWEFICKTRANWLAISDGLALRHLCELWGLRAAALVVLKDQPTDKNVRCAFVSYGVEFTKLSARFGLTPQDRERLGVVSEGQYDPAAEFIA